MTHKMGNLGDFFIHKEMGACGVIVAPFASKTRIYDPTMEQYVFEVDGTMYLSVLDQNDMDNSSLVHSLIAQNEDHSFNHIENCLFTIEEEIHWYEPDSSDLDFVKPFLFHNGKELTASWFTRQWLRTFPSEIKCYQLITWPSGIITTVTPIQITADPAMWQFIINIKTLNKDETFTLQNKPFKATLSTSMPKLHMVFVNKIDPEETIFQPAPLDFISDSQGEVITVHMPPVPLDVT